MSKTYKDKANYARFHNREDILDSDLRELADIMERHYSKNRAGLRSGNNRKYYSDKKVFDRRIERSKEKRQFAREFDDGIN
jgi:hypothetical protein